MTVNWNWRNFLIESYIFLPHLTAVIIEEKLSSKINISAAYFAVSVPAIFIAKPTSALLKAGASFVPSPVTATTFFLSLIPTTRAYLSFGLLQASTRKFFQILSKFFAF